MPIKRNSFEKGKFKARHNESETHPVAKLLKKNSHLAYKVDEITRVTKVNKHTVRGALKKLSREGLVVHKTPYFAWKKAARKVRVRK